LCTNHQPNSPGDSYVRWPYARDATGHENQMTVFGFGRPGWQSPDQHTPQLTGLPARFTIALAKADAVAALTARLLESCRWHAASRLGLIADWNSTCTPLLKPESRPAGHRDYLTCP
jgi:hypothetical protein